MAKNDWFNDFGKDKDTSNGDKLKAELLKALPAIRQFRAQGGEMQVAFMAPMVWSMIGSPDPQMLNDISSKITSAPKSELSQLFKDFADQTDPAKALKAIESTRKQIQNTPQQSRIALDKFVRDVIPARLLNILALLSETDLGKTSEQDIKDEAALYASKTDAELAADRVKHMEIVPFAEMENALHEILQKASPQALETFLSTLSTSFTGNEVSDLILTGIDLVEEAGTAVEQGKDIEFDKLSVSGNFQASLKKLLAAVDTSLVTAGLVPDTDVIAAFDENKRRRDTTNNAGPLFKPNPNKPGNTPGAPKP